MGVLQATAMLAQGKAQPPDLLEIIRNHLIVLAVAAVVAGLQARVLVATEVLMAQTAMAQVVIVQGLAANLAAVKVQQPRNFTAAPQLHLAAAVAVR